MRMFRTPASPACQAVKNGSVNSGIPNGIRCPCARPHLSMCDGGIQNNVDSAKDEMLELISRQWHGKGDDRRYHN